MRPGRACVCLVVVAVALWSNPSFAQTPKTESAADAASQAIEKERAIWAMIKRNDFSALDATTKGMMFVGPTGVVPEWKPGLAEATFKGCVLAKYALDSMQTRTHGPNLVVLSYKATTDWTCGGTKSPSPTYETAVWQRTSAGWKVLYGGSTPVAK